MDYYFNWRSLFRVLPVSFFSLNLFFSPHNDSLSETHRLIGLAEKCKPCHGSLFASSFSFWKRVLALEAVETAKDAMEFWFDEYIGHDMLLILMRDLWFIIASYSVPPEPLSRSARVDASTWIFALGFISTIHFERFDDAIRYYSRSIEYNPGHDTPYINRSCCFSEQKRFDLALIDVSYAISTIKSLDPFA